MMTEDDITRAVIGIAVEIHRQLGPGLLESAWQGILVEEIKSQGFPVESQRLVPVRFNGRVYEHGFRLDLLVGSRVVIDFKRTERPAAVHARQLLTFLRCLDLSVGLVVNLGMTRAIDGIVRVVNNGLAHDRQMAESENQAVSYHWSGVRCRLRCTVYAEARRRGANNIDGLAQFQVLIGNYA